jgi:N-carbamoyl-L-amino-acid hydrolase
MREPRVDGARLWQRLMRHAEVGARPDGGLNREALTEADRAGRDLFAQWCRELDLELAVDKLGTMFATYAGREDGDAIGLGSHLDTQPYGGRFDGTLGVLAALECVETLQERAIRPRRPITIVNWTAEEGSRFLASMAASGVYSGVFPPDAPDAWVDAKGIRFRDALRAIGYEGDEAVGARRFAAFLELHIEQGPVLEAESAVVGIVTGAQAMSFNTVVIEGREAHAGTTPMERRRDPVAALTRILATCEAVVRSTPDARFTVGSIETEPKSHSSIPREVRFTLDLRHPDDAVLARLVAAFEQAASAERDRGFHVWREEFGASPALAFDPRCIDAVREAAITVGAPSREIVSGAGHDACYVARVCPTGMIFSPCKDGISHNPAESITPHEAETTANVLLLAALRMAED